MSETVSSSERYLVIDVETTGLYHSDRVIEVAALTVTRQGDVIDEWDTLVNPERDIGAYHLHGITASMVSAAPRFSEVASALAARIEGAVLVAHNLPFDSRMLVDEYGRAGARLDCGRGLCTLRLSGQRLPDACACRGISLDSHHRALVDARATAELLTVLKPDNSIQKVASITGLGANAAPRTLRREAVIGGASQIPHLVRHRMRYRGEDGSVLEYLDMLDWALADLAIAEEERSELALLAWELGMSHDEVRRAHGRYMHELIVAAVRDRVVTPEEERILRATSIALGLDPGLIEEEIGPWRLQGKLVQLQPGMTVCFTGTAVSASGSEVPREVLIAIAEGLGLLVVSGVNKKGCDIVVAGDSGSLSGKAQKARGYGLPIVHARDFLLAEPGSCLPAC